MPGIEIHHYTNEEKADNYIKALKEAHDRYCGQDYAPDSHIEASWKILKNKIYIEARSIADSSCDKFLSPTNEKKCRLEYYGVVYEGNAQVLADLLKPKIQEKKPKHNLTGNPKTQKYEKNSVSSLKPRTEETQQNESGHRYQQFIRYNQMRSR